jgi:cytochrome c5
MKKLFVAGVLALLIVGHVSLGASQEVSDQACQQTIKTNCTKCHGTGKICTELDKADANWKKIVAEMGKRGTLSQEIQDAVFTCLTAKPEPKKLVCDK